MSIFKLRFVIFIIVIKYGYISIDGIRLPFEKVLRVNRFVDCPEYRHLPLSFQDVRFIPSGKSYYVTAKIVASRNIDSNLKLLLKFERCKSKENLDSCEPYNDLHIKNICQMTLADKKPWTPFVSSVRPPLSFPLKKGTYIAQNGSFDADALSFFPINGFFWKVRAKIYEGSYEEETPIMCTYVEGEIINV
ncbi:hypothetical protein FQA39_LY04509 [Lamprigera yunnana]|nr:hypothetical protein FQA39_LY04509 [Lamprigera yunnana]